MKDLANQRCFNHTNREAVAVCTECAHFFCRECATEHDDRLICASCLKKKLKSGRGKQFRFIGLFRMGQFLFGFLILWIFFYYMGQILVSVPSSFHEGTVWQKGWLDHE